jgi:DNA helicase HerA-like ATPase
MSLAFRRRPVHRPQLVRPGDPVSIRVKPSERACFFGRTGSGKTTLATRLLLESAATVRWVILDSKQQIDLPGVPVNRTFKPKQPRQIIRVPDIEGAEVALWQLHILRIWTAKNRVIYVDELLDVIPTARRLGPGLGRAIRTGRSRGVGVWAGSQRPSDIPSQVFTESEHFFNFQLSFARDREKIASFTDDSLLPFLEGNRGHDLVYYNVLEQRIAVIRQ